MRLSPERLTSSWLDEANFSTQIAAATDLDAERLSSLATRLLEAITRRYPGSKLLRNASKMRVFCSLRERDDLLRYLNDNYPRLSNRLLTRPNGLVLRMDGISPDLFTRREHIDGDLKSDSGNC